MAWAKTVAVVVPSPAVSEVLLATSLTIWAPIFSNLSSSSISFATVTPSFVTVGDPKDFSRITFLPFGPNVTLTASAKTLTPRKMEVLASWSNLSSFAIVTYLHFFLVLSSSFAFYNAQNVFFSHDEVFFTFDL